MKFFPWQKKRPPLSEEESRIIVKAIRHAEQRTSGEVRVYVEGRCKFVDAIDRAAEIFFQLEMQKTEARNAVLVYVAMKDRQVAIFADEGIHQRVDAHYWQNLVKEMVGKFSRHDYAVAIGDCVIQIGEALTHNFPFDKDNDKNELPDNIVFGR